MNENRASNPANPQPVVAAQAESKRIPMSLPIAKLAVPDIPGYHLHWFLGDMRVARALKAGYEFVDEDETSLSDKSPSVGEGRDMGTRVSLIGGSDFDQRGQPERLYLMKLRNELWNDDQKELEGRSAQMLEALRVGQVNAGEGGDTSHRYVNESTNNQINRNVFRPKKLSK